MSNRVETGFSESQAIELLEINISGWVEAERLDVLLLRAICRLSAETPERARGGFTSPEIVEAIGLIRGRSWSSSDDKSLMSKDVRIQWNKLSATWEAKQVGIDQSFADHGYALAPRLDKSEGGGSGHLSRYRITWLPSTTALTTHSTSGAQELPSGWVRYICEDIKDAGLIARIFAKGYILSGWKRWFFVLFLALPLLLLFLLFVYALFGVTFSAALGAKVALNSVISFAVIYTATFLTVGSIFTLPFDKISAAPWWLQSTNSDRLLEFRSPPYYPERSIKAVRYTGICPICNGQVITRKSWLEFRGRIVGRCENTPKEHVFSFDHVMRRGYPLRIPQCA